MILGFDTIGNHVVDSEYYTSKDSGFYSIEMQKGIVDELYISKNGEITDSTKKDWVIDTYLKAEFNNNLEAGNVGLGGLSIDRWKIRRRKIDSTKFKDLGVIPMGADENLYFIDVTPRSRITYEYNVIPMSGDIEGEAHTIIIEVQFEHWWLIDDYESYPFFVNIEVGDIVTNQQRRVFDEGFSKFPVVAYGEQQYQSGTITAMLLDSFVVTSKDYRDKVEKFINNGKPKYLKNPYGDLWIVDTHTSKRNVIPNRMLSSDMFVTDDVSLITFNWTEIQDVDETS